LEEHEDVVVETRAIDGLALLGSRLIPSASVCHFAALASEVALPLEASYASDEGRGQACRFSFDLGMQRRA
jgi:hypothetical protein